MISVVITAAGNSTRFGENKLLADIAGKPLIIRTVQIFAEHPQIDEIIITTKGQDISFYENLFKEHHLKVQVIEGGKERIESVYNGAIASKGDIILTHDGARPLTPQWLIDHLILATREHGAAMTAVPPTATIKYAEDDMIIRKSFLRATTWIAQTPQGFRRDILLTTFAKAVGNSYFVATDDSEIVAEFGYPVKIVPGDYVNLKVTVRSDLKVASELFFEQASEKLSPALQASQKLAFSNT